MTLLRLLLASIWRFRLTNLGVMLGVAVATTVITGALIVGDAMRYTLSRTAEERLGKVSHALIAGDRFFTDELVRQLGNDASGLIALQGVLSTPDGKTRANDVSVYGIDDRFAALLGGPTRPQAGEAALSESLAARLQVKTGDTLVLRVHEPSALPMDAALVDASKPALAMRLTVASVVDAEQGGRFSLRAQQQTPMNLYVDRAWLAEQIGMDQRANAALLASAPGAFKISLDDLELELRELPDRGNELSTPRVFIDASIERDLQPMQGQRLLTYMVNTIAHGDNQSPYAMVCAADALGALDLKDDEIAINSWLADDVGASVGDRLTLTYYLPDEGGRLIEASTTFTVAQVVPIEGAFADRTLTPQFPGLAEAETLSRWDAGPAIDRRRIRDKDEAYWDDYRATPKAFISLKIGQKLWSNRFGTLTAIRFSPHKMTAESRVLSHIDPAPLGFVARDVKAQAKLAAVGTVDFGQLFLSLSGFIIIAAVVLTATLFAMSVEQRARQLGTLLALGLTRRQVLILIVGEGTLVALVGAVVGVIGGYAYAAGVIEGLSGVWSGAVAGSPVLLHVRLTSVVIGPMSAMVISVLAMWLSLRSLVRRPARELMGGAVGKVSGRPLLPSMVWWGLTALMPLPAMILTQIKTGAMVAPARFGIGACLLASLLFALTGGLSSMSMTATEPTGKKGPRPLTIETLVLRNLSRRRGRTLTAVFTLACGVFLVLAVAGFRLSSSDDPTNRASGTGGFALVVEATQPIVYDLNTQLGRDHYALDEDELPAGSVVPFRVNGGDDASCLNLNQTQSPRVLGVDPALLQSRGAFTFQDAAGKSRDWPMLEQQGPSPFSQAVPAIADANTAQWALKLAVGDTMQLTDEQGRPFTIELVGTIENSILQGSLIIDERAFERLYPTTSGHRLLLVDVAKRGQASSLPEERVATATLLEEVLVDEGVTVTPTTDRLADFNRMQNTYLTIFQALGGLGVVLGALGLGVIAARNLLERRSELALYSAVGFSRGRIARLTLIEHGLMLGLPRTSLPHRCQCCNRRGNKGAIKTT